MKRLALLLSVAWLLPVPAQAAYPFSAARATTPLPSNCTYPVDGGCSVASGSLRVLTNPQTFAAQSGQTWTSSHPWNWNSPVLDYSAGYTSVSLDPATASIPGCSYSAGPPAVLTCSGANLDLSASHLDLSLHGGTCLHISGTGTLKIGEFYFKQGTNDCSSQFGFIRVDRGSSGTCASLEISNAEIDGDPTTGAFQSTDPFGVFDTGTCPTPPDHTNITNVVSQNLPSRLLSSQLTGNQVINRLFVNGIDLSAADLGTHAEIWGATQNAAAVTLSQSWTDVVYIQPVNSPNPASNFASPFEPATTTNTATTVSVSMTRVLIVNNNATLGAAGTNTGIINGGGIATYPSWILNSIAGDMTGATTCFNNATASTFTVTSAFSLVSGSAITPAACPDHH